MVGVGFCGGILYSPCMCIQGIVPLLGEHLLQFMFLYPPSLTLHLFPLLFLFVMLTFFSFFSSSSSSSSSPCSLASLIGGWIILMIGGCVYKRIVAGAKGWEQVPCISVYREFGNISADGCDFVCRSRPRTVVEYVSPYNNL